MFKLKKLIKQIFCKERNTFFDSREIENIWYTKRLMTSLANKLGIFESEMRGKKFNADFVMINNYEAELKSLQKLLREQKKIIKRLKDNHTYNSFK